MSPALADDDAQRVSREDDELRGTVFIGPEGQRLIYEPDYETGAHDHEMVMARLRGRYRSAHPERLER